jgi:hypothetical protein
MKVGMLWFDNDKTRTLQEKIERAVKYYKDKHKLDPSVCYVNPAALEGIELKPNGVEVRSANTVLPHHFWVGIEEKKPSGRRAA